MKIKIDKDIIKKTLKALAPIIIDILMGMGKKGK